MPRLPSRPERTAQWRALRTHQRSLQQRHLRELFAEDPDRARRYRVEAAGLHADLSKHRVTDETWQLLVALAERCGVPDRIEAMFRGEPINVTERRPALHVALRAPRGQRLVVDGVDVVAQVHQVLDRMGDLAARVRGGHWRGATGEPISTVVNIGIGGSDLGPQMAYQALTPHRAPRPACRFVSNVDGADLAGALSDLDPATTLFIVSSKSFTTVETLTNAASARRWLTAKLGEDAVHRHFVAVSTNTAAVTEFGIDPANMFEIWDWVGGRFSLDSAIGLSLMIAIGPEAFAQLLAGYRAVDEHLREAPLAANLPVLMALLGIWYRNFFGAETHAVLPYAADLGRFPAFLQQLEMESNGKSVDRHGRLVGCGTAPVVWGEPGTDGQHAFLQLIHQGTPLVPVDFLAFARPGHDLPDHHDLLIANCFAQSKALAFGRSAAEVAGQGDPEDQVAGQGDPDGLVAHRTFPGNRPSTTVLAPELTPAVLGSLIALYEHKVFVQGILWDINSFDQWGVELGKELARPLAAQLAAGDDGAAGQDPSTTSLLTRYRALRTTPPRTRPGGTPG